MIKGSLFTLVVLISTALANMDPHYNMQTHLRRRFPTVNSRAFSTVHINCQNMCDPGAKWFNLKACNDLCPRSRDKTDCDQSLHMKKATRFLFHYFPGPTANQIADGCEDESKSHGDFKRCVQSFIDLHMPELKGFKHSDDCHRSGAYNTREDTVPYTFVKFFKMSEAGALTNPNAV